MAQVKHVLRFEKDLQVWREGEQQLANLAGPDVVAGRIVTAMDPLPYKPRPPAARAPPAAEVSGRSTSDPDDASVANPQTYYAADSSS